MFLYCIPCIPSYLFKVTLLTMEFGILLRERERERERERMGGVWEFGVLEGYEEVCLEFGVRLF